MGARHVDGVGVNPAEAAEIADPLRREIGGGEPHRLLALGGIHQLDVVVIVNIGVSVSAGAPAQAGHTVGHILALEKEALGAFNLGTGQGISVKEIVEACRRVTGRTIPVRMCPRRPGDPPALFASGRKAREVLGWNPVHSDVETIVRDAWSAHQEFPNGYGKGR